MKELAQFNRKWLEEPTSPDDVLGHSRHRPARSNPIGVATGQVSKTVSSSSSSSGQRHPLPAGRQLSHAARQRGGWRSSHGGQGSASRLSAPGAWASASTSSTSPTSLHRVTQPRDVCASTSTTCTLHENFVIVHLRNALRRASRPGYSITIKPARSMPTNIRTATCAPAGDVA